MLNWDNCRFDYCRVDRARQFCTSYTGTSLSLAFHPIAQKLSRPGLLRNGEFGLQCPSGVEKGDRMQATAVRAIQHWIADDTDAIAVL